MSKLTAPQMRALRLLYTHDIYTPADEEKRAAIALPVAQALARAGYARVEHFGWGHGYGNWKATITQAGKDKVSPPPIEPGLSYSMFLVSDPDHSTNTENGADALTTLASMVRGRMQGLDRHVRDKMSTAVVKVLGMDPEHVRWPVRLRFVTNAFVYLDFAAEQCREREEEKEG